MEKLLTIICTLPITSNEAERSFSKLKYIKGDRRSTMNNERYNTKPIKTINIGLLVTLVLYSLRYNPDTNQPIFISISSTNDNEIIFAVFLHCSPACNLSDLSDLFLPFREQQEYRMLL